jgi:phospholipid N-methyltransferase
MKPDTLIRNEGIEILAKNLGLVEAERFIMLIQKEPFDHTKWQENLFENMTVEEVSKNAAAYRSSHTAAL